jgi:phosphatidylinositol alpha-1,6-mannosyltransferase
MNLVISHDFFPKIGGAHYWLYEVYRRWPSRVALLTTDYACHPRLAQEQREFDGSYHGALTNVRSLDPFKEINLFSLRCLRQFHEQVKTIDRAVGSGDAVLHCLRAFPEGLLGLLFKMRYPGRSSLVTYAHGEEILIAQTSRQLKVIAKQVYSRSDLIIANSENTRRVVLELCPRASVVCIHPGVNSGECSPPKEDLRAYRSRLGWPADTVVLSTVARMEARKNHLMIIRALAELRKERQSVAYICAGDGQERDRLIGLAQELGLRDWVRFPGAVTDQEKKLIYGTSHIYAMPSIQVGEMIEGFGIVFLEAAAAGMPSISGNTGGQSEAVIHGKTGFVVDGTSLPEVHQAVRNLVQDIELRAVMGREGKRWAAEHDWTKVVERTCTAIDGVLRGRKRGSKAISSTVDDEKQPPG